MANKGKLIEKLSIGSIDAHELRALFKILGAVLKRQKGSHEIWFFNGARMVLATHGKDLKPYQVKQAKQFLGL